MTAASGANVGVGARAKLTLAWVVLSSAEGTGAVAGERPCTGLGATACLKLSPAVKWGAGAYAGADAGADVAVA